MEITINDLLNIKNAHIIDIRTKEKYNDNHIPGAINIDYDDLINNHSKYLNKNDKYYLYCQKGITSKTVSQILRAYGYTIYNVIGGYESYVLKRM